MYMELNKKKKSGPGIISKLFSWLAKIVGEVISKLIIYIVIIILLYILFKNYLYI